MRIGVISDTHMPKKAQTIPQVIMDAFQGVDLILHAGDLTVRSVLDELAEAAPVYAVAGNNDPADLVAELGWTRVLDLAGYRIGLTHGHYGTGVTTPQRALSHFPGVHCVVFGHSHMPYNEWHGPTLAFNPGSATDRRRAPFCSYGMLHLEPTGIRAEIHHLS